MTDKPVSNGDLDAAVVEPIQDPPADPVEPTDPATPTPAEPDDPSLRSQLGRRVSRMERNLSTFMDEMRGTLYELRQPSSPASDPLGEGDDDDPIPMTRGELRSLIRNEQDRLQTERSTADTKYQKTYIGALAKLGLDLDEDAHEQIMGEVFNNPEINLRRTGNPEFDAQHNYLLAERAIRNRGTAKPRTQPTNPLEGKDPSAPLGGPSGSEGDPPARMPAVQLDAHAQDFVNRVGWDKEKVNKALQGEAPLSLRGKIGS